MRADAKSKLQTDMEDVSTADMSLFKTEDREISGTDQDPPFTPLAEPIGTVGGGFTIGMPQSMDREEMRAMIRESQNQHLSELWATAQ